MNNYNKLFEEFNKYDSLIFYLPYNYAIALYRYTEVYNKDLLSKITIIIPEQWEFNEIPGHLKLEFNIINKLEKSLFINALFIAENYSTINKFNWFFKSVNFNNFIYWDLISKLLNIENRIHPYKTDIFLDIAHGCNFACKGCSHFSPLVSKENAYVDFNLLKNDIDCIFTKFPIDRIRQIHLIGGEPTIHPELENIIKYIRKLFPNIYLEIDSNGFLLLNAKQSFLDFCSSQNITISISKYNINFDYNKLEHLLIKNNINFSLHNVEESWNWLLRKNPIDNYLNFINCNMHTHIYIYNKIIYHCIFGIKVKYFNQYFNQNLPVDNGFNISNLNYYEYFAAYLKPPELCKYCKGKGIKATKWQQSKYKISEWAEDNFNDD